MFISTQNIRSKQRASPPKRGAAEPVNLKIHRNPAKTAQRPFGLVRSRAHFFARISCVFKECVSHGLGRWFWSFCRNKRTIKSQNLSLTKVLPKAIESLSAVADKSLNPESLKHLCPCLRKQTILAHPCSSAAADKTSAPAPCPTWRMNPDRPDGLNPQIKNHQQPKANRQQPKANHQINIH